MRKILFLLSLAFALASCSGIPAKIVKPGSVYSKSKYGVCFDAKDLPKLNHYCNIEIKR